MMMIKTVRLIRELSHQRARLAAATAGHSEVTRQFYQEVEALERKGAELDKRDLVDRLRRCEGAAE